MAQSQSFHSVSAVTSGFTSHSRGMTYSLYYKLMSLNWSVRRMCWRGVCVCAQLNVCACVCIMHICVSVNLCVCVCTCVHMKCLFTWLFLPQIWAHRCCNLVCLVLFSLGQMAGSLIWFPWVLIDCHWTTLPFIKPFYTEASGFKPANTYVFVQVSCQVLMNIISCKITIDHCQVEEGRCSYVSSQTGVSGVQWPTQHP